MPSADAITVSLLPKLRRTIKAQVATGCYQTAGKARRAGLRLLTKDGPPKRTAAMGALGASSPSGTSASDDT